MRKRLGVEVAGQLVRRLADLQAADTIADLVVGQPRSAADGAAIVIDLAVGKSLSIRSGHVNHPRTLTGGIDWRKVTRVQVVAIGDAHV